MECSQINSIIFSSEVFIQNLNIIPLTKNNLLLRLFLILCASFYIIRKFWSCNIQILNCSIQTSFNTKTWILFNVLAPIYVYMLMFLFFFILFHRSECTKSSMYNKTKMNYLHLSSSLLFFFFFLILTINIFFLHPFLYFIVP